jgi:hypothetical protein
MNSVGEGPTFAIELHKGSGGWLMKLEKHPSGTGRKWKCGERQLGAVSHLKAASPLSAPPRHF